MIRKIVIAVLTLSVIVTLTIDVLSYIPLTSWPMPFQPRMSLKGPPLPGCHVWISWNDNRYLLEFHNGWTYLHRTMFIPASEVAGVAGVIFKMPIALVLAVLASYPLVVFILGPLRRWRRRRKGLCIKCEFDLRD